MFALRQLTSPDGHRSHVAKV